MTLATQIPLEVAVPGRGGRAVRGGMVVEGKVIVEIKAGAGLDGAHEAQLINYLKATGISIGLLINFGRKVEIKRRVF